MPRRQGGTGGLGVGSNSDEAYAALVNQSTIDNKCTAKVYIKPGSAAQSLFYLKAAPGEVFGCGDRMPPKTNGISASNATLLKDWINAGAKK